MQKGAWWGQVESGAESFFFPGAFKSCAKSMKSLEPGDFYAAINECGGGVGGHGWFPAR
jgi:hypothetical protein